MALILGKEKLNGFQEMEIVIGKWLSSIEHKIAGPSGLFEARQSSSPQRKQAPRKVGMDRQEKWNPRQQKSS